MMNTALCSNKQQLELVVGEVTRVIRRHGKGPKLLIRMIDGRTVTLFCKKLTKAKGGTYVMVQATRHYYSTGESYFAAIGPEEQWL